MAPKFRYRLESYTSKKISTVIISIEELEEASTSMEPFNKFVEQRWGDDVNTFKILSRDMSIGVKDKNEIEIFEGDVIKRGKKIIGEVYYDEKHGVFRINRDETKGTSFAELVILEEDFGEKEGFEVIGNIHENPELLEEMKE